MGNVYYMCYMLADQSLKTWGLTNKAVKVWDIALGVLTKEQRLIRQQHVRLDANPINCHGLLPVWAYTDKIICIHSHESVWNNHGVHSNTGTGPNYPCFLHGPMQQE